MVFICPYLIYYLGFRWLMIFVWSVMNLLLMSDQAIATEIGHRFRALRLRHNLTQQQLAEAVALSLNAIKALEKGSAKLSTMIAVLRELGDLEQLNHFIPEISVSPLQLAKQQGRVRQRASGVKARAGRDEGELW